MAKDWRPAAEALRAYREARGLTQGALASAAGVNRSTIANLERDPRSNPTASTLASLQRATGIDLLALAAGVSP